MHLSLSLSHTHKDTHNSERSSGPFAWDPTHQQFSHIHHSPVTFHLKCSSTHSYILRAAKVGVCCKHLYPFENVLNKNGIELGDSQEFKTRLCAFRREQLALMQLPPCDVDVLYFKSVSAGCSAATAAPDFLQSCKQPVPHTAGCCYPPALISSSN